MISGNQKIRLAIEFASLFLIAPLLLFLLPSRLGIYCTLWGAGLYGFFGLKLMPDFSWAKLWHGDGWTRTGMRNMFLHFAMLAVVLAGLTLILLPERFVRFPLDRFPLWLAVMVLYPLLSIVPQEILYRSFYFERYRGLVPLEGWAGIALNGALFGFSHIVLRNWIAPTFCALGGMLFAYSYQQHRSLKWAVIEHSLYGCWVFTVGIGWYFFTGNWVH